MVIKPGERFQVGADLVADAARARGAIAADQAQIDPCEDNLRATL